MNDSKEGETQLAEQLRRLAEATSAQQYHESPRPHIDQPGLPNPAHVYQRQAGELADSTAIPTNGPGASFDAAELLRQMAQLPQGQQSGGVDYQQGQQHRAHQSTVSQAAEEHGMRTDLWSRQGQALQDLISYLPSNINFPREQPSMPRDLQRFANSGATQAAAAHALSELHGQQAPQTVGQFMSPPPPVPNVGGWQDGVDAGSLDMRAAGSGGLRSGSVSGSLDRRESASHAALVDAGFAGGVPPAIPRVPQVVHPGPHQASAQLGHDVAGPPAASQLTAGKGTVLAAKMLTESDVKHSRAILPRVAVENNLPFLLGYRTFGMYLPDEEGNSWEFVVKSWANGRSDKTGATPRRKDRRVYVVEQMASFLSKHHLNVGDVVGIVHVNGHLEMHCQTHALKGWIERPTYGSPPLDTFPTPVPGKCSLLEDVQGDAARRCTRTPNCSKPDRHQGQCEGNTDGHRMPANLVATFKLKLWPQPTCVDPPAQPDPTKVPELEPAHLLEGPLVTFRVTQDMLNTGVMEMPVGNVVKVPEHLCEEPIIRIQVQVAPGTSHTIFFTVMPRTELGQAEAGGASGGAPGADVPAPVDPQSDVPPMLPSGAPLAVPSPTIPSPGSLATPGSMPSPGAMEQPTGSQLNPMKSPLFPSDASDVPAVSELRGWRISGLKEVLQSIGCSIADELSIEKAETIVAHRSSHTHLPPLPASVQPITPPVPGTFNMNLCQRTQGCMKNENHTGFCSGHRGFKRKNTVGTGDEGAGGGRRKSGGKGKSRGGMIDVKAADMTAHGAVPPGIDARSLPGDANTTLLQQFHSAVPPPARSQQQRTKPELSAADVLLQISHSPSSNMPTSMPAPDQLGMPAIQRVTEEGQWQTPESHMAARTAAATCHGMSLAQMALQEPEQRIAAEQQNPGFLDALLQNASEFAQHHRPPA